MKIAALLLLELLVLLSQTAVVINPKQLRDGRKVNADRGAIIQRASTGSSPLSELSVEAREPGKSWPLKVIPGRISGPQDELYEFDESCNDNTQRQKITDAYNMATKLAEESEAKLKALAAGLPTKLNPKKEETENQNWIAQTDPAYTQMFYALDHHIEDVRKVYEKMIYGMKSSRSDPRSARRGVFLRFICNPLAKQSDGKYICEGGTQAMTTNVANREIMEEIYTLSYDASIVLCPPFFDDAQFPSTQVLEQHLDQNCNLDRVQSRDRIMIHEWCHLVWVADLKGQIENYGYLLAAKTAGSATGKNRKASWGTAKENADNFAWYAIYHHWNELCPGTTAGNSCGDVWPQGGTSKDPKSLNFWSPPKPNPIQFQ